jgi:hypothetical protein
VQLLLAAGADVHAKAFVGGQSAVARAIHMNWVSVVRLLVESRADVNNSSSGAIPMLTQAVAAWQFDVSDCVRVCVCAHACACVCVHVLSVSVPRRCVCCVCVRA